MSALLLVPAFLILIGILVALALAGAAGKPTPRPRRDDELEHRIGGGWRWS